MLFITPNVKITISPRKYRFHAVKIFSLSKKNIQKNTQINWRYIMNLSLQFFIDNIFGVLFLIIAFTNLSLSPIKMRNKLCMAAGISIITIFLYPVCGEFSTYLVIYFTVFVSVIGQKKKFQICILGIMGYIYNVFYSY